ncbi:MAG TPA: acyl-CoA dehydrogenase family protein [Acidimicrobiales bacterium]|nr:acyl-CoA dehydrogenase family protein [Acidimicrobiales bacterium]
MTATTHDTEGAQEAPELAEFRTKCRAFLEANAKRRQVRKPASEDDDDEISEMQGANLEAAKAYQSALYDAGLAGITWPREVGGQGLSNEHQRVFNEEAADFETPIGVYTIGLGMVIPTIVEHGTDEQKERYVRKALRGEEIWSQLFSEPGAGSDVASLQMKAERDGDEFVLNGQKVWTTGAQHSDFGAVIARTNPDNPKHRGITMFIIDFSDPNIDVRPLRQMNGGSGFNEVYFTDVRVPVTNVVGAVDDGWRCAIAMLANERVAIGSGGGGARRGSGGGIDALAKLARQRGLIDDPVIRQGIADVYIRQRIIGFIGQRTRAALKSGKAPGPEGSIAKLAGALLSRRSSDLGIAIAGASGQAWLPGDRRSPRWAAAVLSAPSSRIAGGTDEIQRNIIGERVLALPKEPQVDRDQPFRELKVGTQR